MTNKNYILEYYDKINSGEIVACNKIKKVYKHIVYNLTRKQDNNYIWHFDINKASKPIIFIESFCYNPAGSTKELIKLDLWQKALIQALFGFIDNQGLRQYKELMLIIARKQGKSTLAAALAIYCMLCEKENSPELYSVSTTKDISKHLWEYGKKIIKFNADLKEFCKIHTADIVSLHNDGIFKPLASDSNNLDGLNISFALLDELHTWKDENLYHVVVDGEASRKNSLTIITTTAGFIRESIYDTKYQQAEKTIQGYDGGDYTDERFLPLIYELDNKQEWKNNKCWIKANPGLGTIKNYTRLAEEVYRCKNGTGNIKNLLTKDFDMPETSSQSYLDFDTLNNDTIIDYMSLNRRYCIAGIDLSRTTDLTSVCIMFKQQNDDRLFVLSQSWITEDCYNRQMDSKNGIPYDKWLQQGFLKISPGHIIDYHLILNYLDEIKEKYDLYIYKIGYDRYGATYLTQDLQDKYGDDVLEEVIQGAKTESIPLQNLKAELQAKNIIYNNNPVLKWCLCNMRVKQDANANLQLTKNRNLQTRDDAAAALLDCMVVYLRNMEDYNNIC